MQELNLSIIVPAYNVEDYIGDCLESFIPLKDHLIEVIVVNDGSTDGTVEIVKTFADKFSNFKLLEQPNQGASAARNLGLSEAKGKYVFFCDSDDYVDANELIVFLNKTLEKELDISIANGKNLVGEEIKSVLKKSNKIINTGVLSGPEFYLLANKHQEFFISICTRLYRTEFLKKNDLNFLTGFMHEDEEFAPRVFALAQKVEYFDLYFYIRRYRLGSVTKNHVHKYHNPKTAPSLIAVLKSLASIPKKILSQNARKVYEHAMMKTYIEILRRELYFVKSNDSSLTFPASEKRDVEKMLSFEFSNFGQRVEALRLKFKIIFLKTLKKSL
jgi:glycosyltransferase involved in cell wall biosynthesis